MSEVHDVPARVREGSDNPMRTMDGYRRVYSASMDDPGGFWLRQTQAMVHWRTVRERMCISGWAT